MKLIKMKWKVQTNLKQRQYNTKSTTVFQLKEQDIHKDIQNQSLQIQKSTTSISYLNIFLGAVNFIILTYFYIRNDVCFTATKWFPISEKKEWYYPIVAIIVLRMLISIVTPLLSQYIKDAPGLTEKNKKYARLALILISVLTIPFSFPLIGAWIAYRKGMEILSDNWFLGNFRRLLNQNERENLYQTSVNNFLEKLETSIEIKNKLKIWALENAKSMLEKYDYGSSYGTQSISENLEIKKDILLREETPETQGFVDNAVDKDFSKGPEFFSWIYQKTVSGVKVFIPGVTDWQIFAGGLITLLAVGVVIVIYVNSNILSLNQTRTILENTKVNAEGIKVNAENIKINAENIKVQTNLAEQISSTLTTGFEAQQLTIQANKVDAEQKFAIILDTMDAQTKAYKSLSDSAILSQQLHEGTHVEITKINTEINDINVTNIGTQTGVNLINVEVNHINEAITRPKSNLLYRSLTESKPRINKTPAQITEIISENVRKHVNPLVTSVNPLVTSVNPSAEQYVSANRLEQILNGIFLDLIS